MTRLGLRGELELLAILRGFGLKCVHGLEQRRITEYLAASDFETNARCRELLRKNRMLPRRKLTNQIDLLAWKEDHWAALAIEEKEQNGARKVLDVGKDFVTLRAFCNENDVREYPRGGRNLWLQCQGEAYLGKAFCFAAGLELEVLPVAVVDYEITVNSLVKTDWAYQRGVFFVNKNAFKWFVGEYAQEKKWISRLAQGRPKLIHGTEYAA